MTAPPHFAFLPGASGQGELWSPVAVHFPEARRALFDLPGFVSHLVLAATSGGIDMSSLGATDWRPSSRTANPTNPSWMWDDHPGTTETLQHLRVPTLLIWATHDPISPLSVGEYLHRLSRHRVSWSWNVTTIGWHESTPTKSPTKSASYEPTRALASSEPAWHGAMWRSRGAVPLVDAGTLAACSGESRRCVRSEHLVVLLE